jgi:HEAT repeat protein
MQLIPAPSVQSAKVRKLLTAMGALGLGAAIFFLCQPAEPVYNGKKLTEWQDQWAAGSHDGSTASAERLGSYREALQAIGTNSIPYGVRNLALNDSRCRTDYARLQTKLPRLLQKLFPKPKPLLQEADGANMFLYIGSNSLPCAIALLNDPSPTVRRAAAWGIAGLRRQSPSAKQGIPALIDALADRDEKVRYYSVISLQEMGPDASNAVPALTKALADVGVGSQTNSRYNLRAAAAHALGRIGPPAATALPELKTALAAPNPYLRGQTAVAIWRIDADVNLALPVLLQEMPGTIEDSKWDWIIALGEMGPRATNAVPQLKIELQKDHKKWVLNYVTNALKRISPADVPDARVK